MRPAGDRARRTLAGVALGALGFGLVVFALVEGRGYGWWTPLRGTALPVSPIPALLVLGLVLLGAYWWRETRRARAGAPALLGVSPLGARGFRWGNAAALVVALGEFGPLFVLRLYLVNVLGLSTLGAGVVPALTAVGAFLAGGLTEGLARSLAPARIPVTVPVRARGPEEEAVS
ncbi:hypothetical protein AB0G79_25830 [Streptomyces sp. NPDC020807]|uniref:hypothetical protein n=1 Tax=Streptomyces sp. NPDC020807 TaxID=3155119 RepID=UPI0033ED4DDA